MTALKDLLKDLDRALELSDEVRVIELRAKIANQHPESKEAAEANYRLGLIALFSDEDLDTAEFCLRLAAKAKDKSWSPRARASLGLVLAKRGKVQQAVFELRKAASKVPPDLETAQALGMVALVYRQQGNPKEADRARGEQMKLLEKIAKNGTGDEPAFAHYLLGMEHKHDGRRAQAKIHLEAAASAGGLPLEELQRVRAALTEV